MIDIYKKLEELQQRRKIVFRGGGSEKNTEQHRKGKLTARERIDTLVDEGSFIELYPFMKKSEDSTDPPGEGVVVGYATINQKPIYVFAHDFTVRGGSLGELQGKKIASMMDLAAKTKVPIIGLNESAGARIQEGVTALDGYGQIFYRNVKYSGVIPQISIILGPNAGGAVYSPALTDFIIMVKDISQMYITGPKVIEAITKETVSAEELGGTYMHSVVNGNCHFLATDELEAFQITTKLLTFIKSTTMSKQLTNKDYCGSLSDLVPSESGKTYDVIPIIEKIVDDGSFLEVHKFFAKNIVVGFASMLGKTIGVVSNQPKHMAGGIDSNASDKAARFIRFCDCFDIPIITLEDVTGFYPGIRYEKEGIIRHGAKLVYAFAEATVPKITVILRKAYGGAFVAMNSKALGADLLFAWPNAEIAVMGPESASSVFETDEKDNQILTTSPYYAAAKGMVDDIIDPRETRIKLIQSLIMLEHKKETGPNRKHGNIPL
ncbi:MULTISPECIES: acyl-CoA carboxylase subunit beta [Oceanobacillus]|uniref:acyl-CoA carboxylase subunit beta n=1 Tax=Oceanobacillus TaxID=182709 RepID=UPI0009848026|nr:acyl-CoA carboxylase subunit beta [Oceanobacillus kimchii]MBT2598390.1 acyl-CoA carboxylase subunit beta [Oceanobacillus sp. ISL-74]MBT2651308.1 acyl-CoA carboxylase subunit beta [Oceanobacillus sp. ISL-73]